MSAKRATRRKSPTARKAAPKSKPAAKSRRRPKVPQGQEAARNRAAKLRAKGEHGKALVALLPDASADALDKAIAGEPETLYVLQVRNRPGHYLVDSNAHPNAKQITTTLSTALTWHNRTGPNTHLRRRPELAADFIPLRLEVKAAPAANSIAGNEQRARAAQAIAAAGPAAGKDATAAA